MAENSAQMYRIESMAKSVLPVRPYVSTVLGWYYTGLITPDEMENCLKWHMEH